MRKKLWMAVLVVGGMTWVAWMAWLVWGADAYATSQAEEAVAVAVDACGSGSRYVLAEKVAAAETAIRYAPLEQREILRAKMDNGLKFSGCQ